MNEIEKLVEICNAFKQGEFNTEEFQKRVETIYLPDICKNTRRTKKWMNLIL